MWKTVIMIVLAQADLKTEPLFVKRMPHDSEEPSAGSIHTSFGNSTSIPHFASSRKKSTLQPSTNAPIIHALFKICLCWYNGYHVLLFPERRKSRAGRTGYDD